MSGKTAVSVKILEREYKLACDLGQEDNLKIAAKALETKLKASMRTPNVTGERAAILVGLNLAHELMLAEQGNADWDGVSEALSNLDQQIDGLIQQVKKA